MPSWTLPSPLSSPITATTTAMAGKDLPKGPRKSPRERKSPVGFYGPAPVDTLSYVTSHKRKRPSEAKKTPPSSIGSSASSAKTRARTRRGIQHCPDCCSSDTSTKQCIMCEVAVGNTPEDFHRHYQICRAAETTAVGCSSFANQPDCYEEGSIEEYEWAGQTRVRVVDLVAQEQAICNSAIQSLDRHNPSNQEPYKRPETDADVNIDEIETQFGVAQYLDEADLYKVLEEADNADSPVSMDRKGYSKEKSLAHHSSIHLVIEALKAKIRQQVAALAKIPSCSVCMETYATPLVSTVCWHVHCESCWARTLLNKKLCPQCMVITSPCDLRRIFL